MKPTTLTILRELPNEDWQGTARLILLNNEFFAVSTADIPRGGMETMAFRCDADGKVSDWLDVAYRPGDSFFEVVSDLLREASC